MTHEQLVTVLCTRIDVNDELIIAHIVGSDEKTIDLLPTWGDAIDMFPVLRDMDKEDFRDLYYAAIALLGDDAKL